MDIGAFEAGSTPTIADITVTVGYGTANRTATMGTDFTAPSGTLAFSPGQSSETITAPVWCDLTDETDATFFVYLTNATNASFADSQGHGTIIYNDNPPAVTINDVTATEGDTGTTNATFTVGLSATSGQTISINAIPS